jgi:hypothetical protein
VDQNPAISTEHEDMGHFHAARLDKEETMNVRTMEGRMYHLEKKNDATLEENTEPDQEKDHFDFVDLQMQSGRNRS